MPCGAGDTLHYDGDFCFVPMLCTAPAKFEMENLRLLSRQQELSSTLKLIGLLFREYAGLKVACYYSSFMF